MVKEVARVIERHDLPSPRRAASQLNQAALAVAVPNRSLLAASASACSWIALMAESG